MNVTSKFRSYTPKFIARMFALSLILSGFNLFGSTTAAPHGKVVYNVKDFSLKKGARVWIDFRSAEEPEAHKTVHNGKIFMYMATPRKVAKGSVDRLVPARPR